MNALALASLACPCGAGCVPVENGDGVYRFDRCGQPVEGAASDGGQRSCEVCGQSLSGYRSDAKFCSGSHRMEQWRVERLSRGESIPGYDSLEAYEARRSRTTRLSEGGS